MICNKVWVCLLKVILNYIPTDMFGCIPYPNYVHTIRKTGYDIVLGKLI